MNKYVESYWAEELPNGVVHLLINTTERWLYYHAFSNTQFLIAENEEDWKDEDVLTIEPFVPEMEDGMYIRTSVVNKDQISFYWIPRKYNDRKSNKELLNSKTLNDSN